MERAKKSYLQRIDRKTVAWSLVYGFLMWYAGIGISFESGETHINLFNVEKLYSPFHFWLAAFCGWVVLLFIIQSYKISEFGKSRLALAISDSGKLCVMGLVACAFMLGVIGIHGGEIFIPYLDALTKANYALTALVIIFMIGVWPHNAVAADCIDIVNGKVYYPGERYTVFPFIGHEIFTIRGTLHIPTMDFPLKVNHNGAKLVVDTTMILSIEDLVKSGMRELDIFELVRAAENAAKSEIEKALNDGQDKDGHPGDFFRLINDLPSAPRQFSFCNIGAVWSGIGNFTIKG